MPAGNVGREVDEKGQFITMAETYQLQKIMFAYKELCKELTDLSVGELSVYDSNGELLGNVDVNKDGPIFYPYKGSR